MDKNPHWRINLAAGSVGPGKGIAIRRVLWHLVWLFAFRPLPRRFGNGWRAFLLRLFGARIGSNVLLCPSMKVMQPWQLEIGSWSAIGDRVEFYNFSKISVGGMVVISQDAYLCTGSHDYTHPYNPLILKPIVIKDEAWVAARVFLAPGVTIGSGSVVGACSVVTRDTPEWTFCAGNPCRPIKPRVISSL